MTLHLIRQNFLLLLITVLEELLNNVVAEDIRRELQGIWENFFEDLVFFITVGSLQFLLDKS